MQITEAAWLDFQERYASCVVATALSRRKNALIPSETFFLTKHVVTTAVWKARLLGAK
jgi:hypothetical protein